MTYIDVFMAAVPRSNKAAYIAHATRFADMFKQYGALEYVEAWANDVPDGDVTSMIKAVAKTDDEDVVVGWMVWPDKGVRDAGWQACERDPVMVEIGGSMPFDGKRMIFGGFDQLLKV